MKHQVTANLLPSVDQRENGGWIPSPWLCVLLTGVRPQGRMAISAHAHKALPFPKGTNAEDGLQEDTTQDQSRWWEVPPPCAQTTGVSRAVPTGWPGSGTKAFQCLLRAGPA